ncbi:hypothetical protein KGG70_gp46 [Streptomyces phage Celia]|uniref:Uncharacterized protein n=1 Tax=Streptomyces phage Celia TaxID=2590946 RepID=A0A516KRB9_9CAUD|nr:hypothetical protein KGG70_gp46 [Streptomyces phage Celia]QDP44238.1 hypothetical protein SEA_CELIA_35 [Streptomyces phage Celia]QFG10498.1 hypothetical protein SEA_URZA_35 [Streptomyces phage Urza]QJD50600.1 hypothetical protein SEA_ITZA_35 [Streptomyces phage Itza]USH45870.1 hypothetical protein SEA_VIEENROSE_35 [Streptomyces phage VieEnRose]
MALNLMTIPTQGGGWFKPKDNKDAVAILIEVKSFDRQRPTPNGPKDSVLADISVFPTQEALNNGTPTVAQGQRIEQTVLARDLETLVGGATIVTLDQVPAKKPGAYPAWVWRAVTDQAKVKQVVAYAEQRDAAVEQAVADAPDFD